MCARGAAHGAVRGAAHGAIFRLKIIHPSSTRGGTHGAPSSGHGVIFRLKIVFLTICPQFSVEVTTERSQSCTHHVPVRAPVGPSMRPSMRPPVGPDLGQLL